jgi:hypothetical protein
MFYYMNLFDEGVYIAPSRLILLSYLSSFSNMLRLQEFSLLIPTASAVLFLVILSFYLARDKFLRVSDGSAKFSSNHLRTCDIISSEPLSSLPEVNKDADISDGWYTDPRLFALERRAIFSKVDRILLSIQPEQ